MQSHSISILVHLKRLSRHLHHNQPLKHKLAVYLDNQQLQVKSNHKNKRRMWYKQMLSLQRSQNSLSVIRIRSLVRKVRKSNKPLRLRSLSVQLSQKVTSQGRRKLHKSKARRNSSNSSNNNNHSNNNNSNNSNNSNNNHNNNNKRKVAPRRRLAALNSISLQHLQQQLQGDQVPPNSLLATWMPRELEEQFRRLQGPRLQMATSLY